LTVNVLHLVRRELLHRKVNFLLGTLAVLTAAGILSASLLLLRAHDEQTNALLAAKQAGLEARIAVLQANTVRAMNHLGFNIVILPRDQNLADWYAEDYAERTMPETYVEKLEASTLVTIENLVPVLRQKVRWPETQWTVILAGTGGGEAPPAGQVDIGAEVARGLNLRSGGSIELFGRPFAVRSVLREEADVEDIAIHLSLADAQALLGKEGRINEIRALECRAAWQDLPRIRAEVARILPDTQVIEKGSETLARVTSIRQVEEKGFAEIEHERAMRADLRASLTQLIGVLLPVLLLVCLAWIYLVSAENVEKRMAEIGVLRSLGFSSGALAVLFLLREVLMGLVGGMLGLALVLALWRVPLSAPLALLIPASAVAIALLGGISPVLRSVNRDPADILRGDV